MKTAKPLQILDNQNVAISPATCIETLYAEIGDKSEVSRKPIIENMLQTRVVQSSSTNGNYVSDIKIDTSTGEMSVIHIETGNMSNIIADVLNNAEIGYKLNAISDYAFSAPLQSVDAGTNSSITKYEVSLNVSNGLHVNGPFLELKNIKIYGGNSGSPIASAEFKQDETSLKLSIDDTLNAKNGVLKVSPIKKEQIAIDHFAEFESFIGKDNIGAEKLGTLKIGLFDTDSSSKVFSKDIYYINKYDPSLLVNRFDTSAVKVNRGIDIETEDINGKVYVKFGLRSNVTTAELANLKADANSNWSKALVLDDEIWYKSAVGPRGKQGPAGPAAPVPNFAIDIVGPGGVGNEGGDASKGFLSVWFTDKEKNNASYGARRLGEVYYHYNNVKNYYAMIDDNISIEDDVKLLSWTDDTKHDTSFIIVKDVAVNEKTDETGKIDYIINTTKQIIDIGDCLKSIKSIIIDDLINSILPIGSVLLWPASTNPPQSSSGNIKWMLCNGDSVSIDAYPKLYDIISTKYGSDGPNKIKLPNLTDRFVYGANLSNVGKIGGQTSVKLTIDNMPKHAHDLRYRWPDSKNADNGLKAKVICRDGNEVLPSGVEFTQTPSQSRTQDAGNSTAFDILPPYIKMAFIIRVK